MKRLLLALLMAGFTLVVAEAPNVSAGDFYKTYHYYDNPSLSGHPCGAWIIYCDELPYREGCITEYYVIYYGGCSESSLACVEASSSEDMFHVAVDQSAKVRFDASGLSR